MPQPEVLGRNGTYVAVRMLHTEGAVWRQFLRANSAETGGDMSRFPTAAHLAAWATWKSPCPQARLRSHAGRMTPRRTTPVELSVQRDRIAA
jgi:deferrochelatase/peroxidase EfeB